MTTKFQIKLAGEWRDYPAREHNLLLNAYVAGMPHAKFRLGRTVHQVSFNHPMKQLNLSTGRAWQMRPPYWVKPPARPLVPAGPTRFVTVPQKHQGTTLLLKGDDGRTLAVQLDRAPKPGQTVAIPMPSAAAAARTRWPRAPSPRHGAQSMRAPSPRPGDQSMRAPSPRGPSPRPSGQSMRYPSSRLGFQSMRASLPRGPSTRPGDQSQSGGSSTPATVKAAGAGVAEAGALVAGGIVLGEHLDTWADTVADAAADVGDWEEPVLKDVGTWVGRAAEDTDAWLSDAAQDTGDVLMYVF